MLPEELAREKIDKQLTAAGWDVVSREEYVPNSTAAIKEALMTGGTESDYLLFVDNKAIAVLEAKREENPLGSDVDEQVEGYARNPESWYGLWADGIVPLVYKANGRKTLFKNLMRDDSDYEELDTMHSPKKMLQLIGAESEFGALPKLDRRGLRDCQYDAEIAFEETLKDGKKKGLAIMATGSGKTYLACMASYRLLNYTPINRVLFLVDRNNLARQTEAEYSQYDRTVGQVEMSSLYEIKRLKKEQDAQAEVVISTIQKLYSILTGQTATGLSEDREDEINSEEEEKDYADKVVLGSDLKLKPDHFQLIIVDECHRSIYGKWRSVLEYFSGAYVLGLTATPTPEAYAFFDSNVVENYTYDDSVIDGVNVPYRVYRIKTEVTEKGGSLDAGTTIIETSKRTGVESVVIASGEDYTGADLDRSVVNRDQIKKVLTAYKDSIYEDLYPEREVDWRYIPKTLIFAKDENHATEIVEVAKEVFGAEFENGEVPNNFVKKITYTAEDSNELIRELRTEKEFRIAVTVTLVATGTDVRPLEVVMFMKDVQSVTLYTQMKGRGCRTIKEDKLVEVTPNAKGKECYYLIDAVGVTEHVMNIPGPTIYMEKNKKLSLDFLLERLSHRDVSDENLFLLRDYCASIQRKYEDNRLFGRHLDSFISDFGFAPRTLASDIQKAYEDGFLDKYPFSSPSEGNKERMWLIIDLIGVKEAKRKLMEMQRGYILSTDQDPDRLLYSGFSKEAASSYIENFKKYIHDNKDSIEALRIIYNSENIVITHKMLVDLRDHLLAENREYSAYQIWKNYKTLDDEGNVEDFDTKRNINALTNLIQVVRYAYGKNKKLTSLVNGYAQRFSLYCGQAQRILSDDQREIMRRIADYIINDGAITTVELNGFDTDLWREGVTSLGVNQLEEEIQVLSRFLLKVA